MHEENAKQVVEIVEMMNFKKNVRKYIERTEKKKVEMGY